MPRIPQNLRKRATDMLKGGYLDFFSSHRIKENRSITEICLKKKKKNTVQIINN